MRRGPADCRPGEWIILGNASRVAKGGTETSHGRTRVDLAAPQPGCIMEPMADVGTPARKALFTLCRGRLALWSFSKPRSLLAAKGTSSKERRLPSNKQSADEHLAETLWFAAPTTWRTVEGRRKSSERRLEQETIGVIHLMPRLARTPCLIISPSSARPPVTRFMKPSGSKPKRENEILHT